ncbi:MAG: hypothetical protein M3178_06665 [Pseudomonadota bacterium]|nr:hypothetical protein [Pseudomonadota bacterium]
MGSGVITLFQDGRAAQLRTERGHDPQSILIRNKVAGFIIVAGQDNIQAVAGQMLGFFAELGFIFPQFPYIAHSRGWSHEDMERNFEIVRASKELAEGAAMLTKRCLDLAGHLITRDKAPHRSNAAAARRTPSKPKGGGAKPGQFAAWARHLAGKPRAALLRNGDHAGTIFAEQHHSFASVARATEMHQGETAMAAKNSQSTGNK